MTVNNDTHWLTMGRLALNGNATDYGDWRKTMTLQLTRWWIPGAYAPDRPPPKTGRWAVDDETLRATSRDYAETMIASLLELEAGPEQAYENKRDAESDCRKMNRGEFD